MIYNVHPAKTNSEHEIVIYLFYANRVYNIPIISQLSSGGFDIKLPDKSITIIRCEFDEKTRKKYFDTSKNYLRLDKYEETKEFLVSLPTNSISITYLETTTRHEAQIFSDEESRNNSLNFTFKTRDRLEGRVDEEVKYNLQVEYIDFTQDHGDFEGGRGKPIKEFYKIELEEIPNERGIVPKDYKYCISAVEIKDIIFEMYKSAFYKHKGRK